MKKILFSALAAVCFMFSGSIANAKTVTKTTDFSDFTAVNASYDFDISLRSGGSHRVDYTVDDILQDYVEVYVKNKTLYVSFNKKAMTKEVKKYYKGKDAPTPVLKVIIYAPYLEEIQLSENVSLDAAGTVFNFNNFSLIAKDKSKVTNLNVNSNNKLSVEATNDADVTVDYTANEVNVKATKSAVLNIDQTSKTLNIVADGSSTMNMSGDAETINVDNAGKAKLNFVSGTAQRLYTAGKGSSEIDALGYTLNEAYLVMKDSKISVSPNNILKLDLKSGAEVQYAGDPALVIVGIEKSTLKPIKK